MVTKQEIRDKLTKLFDFEPLDLSNRCSCTVGWIDEIDDKEAVFNKYFKSIEQTNNEKLVERFAYKNKEVLMAASEKLRNNEEFMLRLFRKKPSTVEFLGTKLRQNVSFLLKLNEINPVCWKYLCKIHYIKATMEEKLSAFIISSPKALLTNSSVMGSNLTGENIGSPILCLEIFKECGGINEKAKNEILEYLRKQTLGINDPYYSNFFELENLDVINAVIKYDTSLVKYFKNANKFLKNFEVACNYFRSLSSWGKYENGIIKKYHYNNLELAKIACLKIAWLLNQFSSEVRNNKNLIFDIAKKGFSSSWIDGVGDKLYKDVNFAEKLKKINPSVYRRWKSNCNKKFNYEVGEYNIF